jgi:hypothetical protein
MKRLSFIALEALLTLASFAGHCYAQSPAVCNFAGTYTVPTAAAGSATYFDNRKQGCYQWRVTYTATGFSALSVQLESAPDNGGVPGSWSAMTPTDGSNPSTSTNTATIGAHQSAAFVRLNLVTATGSGSLTYQTWGANSTSNIAGTSGGGGGGGALTQIAKVVATGVQNSFTFSSIPGSYSTLILQVFGSSKTSATSEDVWVQFNGDTSSNYSNSNFFNSASNTAYTSYGNVNTNTPDFCTISGATATYKGGICILSIPGYASSFTKAASIQNSAPVSATNKDLQNHYSGIFWNSTSAITSMLISTFTGANFVAGSTAILYGMN